MIRIQILYHIFPIFTIRKTKKYFKYEFVPIFVKIKITSSKYIQLVFYMILLSDIIILSIFNSIFIQTGKTPYYHGNSMQFPCLYYISRISTAFFAKLIPFSAKTNNILHPFTFLPYTITETPDFCVKVYFCLIVRFYPLSPSYQRHPKTKKQGLTTHRDEPHQA